MPRTRLPIRPRPRKPPLTVALILRWADEYHRTRGRWPFIEAGRIPGTPDLTWAAVDQCLRGGHRGLPGGSTLARLLLERRGKPHPHHLPPLTIPLILAWADRDRRRTGAWPHSHSVRQIPGAPPGTTWNAVDCALARGKRGLPGGSTLADLLATRRGVRNRMSVPDLTAAQLLAWADDHRRRTGAWPKYTSGPIAAAPGETWNAVDTALYAGIRGLPGGDSLARFLATHRGVRNKAGLPCLTAGQVRGWAEGYYRRAGHWPRVKSGPVPEAPGETWSGINAALATGMRGLPGGSSLFQLLNGRPGGAVTPGDRR